ncbi:sigma-54-dependent Fis family transcriptional regulator [Zobellella endophytica]|uniref:Sigma-54-dependent Fis family transcriptional regulator n=1 Tax=Zobellella endophytica TaxID=2116700 RepID=A0A2P7RAZ6_9GAMM|nr:sigma 54-interacting transcriptional regulator [Zobellella endophytica]PSJ47391.1 sigma-54-dependent Fis family transcriptional regulator [Zobellella endophytica]
MPMPFEPQSGNGLTRELIEVLFPMFEQASAGAIAVDREGRISWINARYANLLGIADAHTVIGRPVRAVIPHSRMPEVVETGRPLLLDIMEYQSQQLVVTRLPFFDEQGRVSGAVAFVLFDDLQPLTPLVSKYRRLHQDLLAAKRALAKRGRGTRYQLGDFVGASPAALEVKRRARLAAGRDIPVLLLGETGTGKEVLAQAIHSLSARAEGPFVGVNLAAIPENLLEAEFFGVAPGAYTGAERRTREGKFQLAHGGTLFLDEVGDMPQGLQAKLLRALQEREIEPLGSNQVVPVDVRVLAATSRDLAAMVAEGSFRSDLYYRLNVLEIPIPPLRARLADLGILCETLLEDICIGQERVEITDAAVAELGRHPWPGNIRELRNVLERAFTMSEGAEVLEVDTLRRVLPVPAASAQPQAEQTGAGPGAAEPEPRPLAEVLARAEAEAIHAALARCGGNRSQAARLLGVSRSVFYEKLARHS